MSTWLRVARVLSWVVIVGGLIVVAIGLYFVVSDLSVRTEKFDGLGAALGLLGAAFGAFCASLAGMILFLMRRAPVAAAWTAAIVYGSAAVLALLLGVLGLVG